MNENGIQWSVSWVWKCGTWVRQNGDEDERKGGRRRRLGQASAAPERAG